VLPFRLRGALECAIVDLEARQSDVSVARSLAGEEVQPDVAVNALLLATGPSTDAPSEARALVAAGFATLKLKLDGSSNGSPGAWWTEMVTEVRAAVGPDVALRVDLNGSLSPEGARAWLQTVADLDLEYVEQPIAPDDGPQELAGLRDAGVPIAADESVTDIASALDLLDAGCDVLVVKPARVGGPLRAAEIVQAAADADVPAVVSTLYETGVGLAAALHVAASVPGDRAHGLATGQLIANDPVEGAPAVISGRMRVVGPGLGVTLA
jgi:L-alanine-DL-glutamate epimerase-like enolase superfamily enzyme